MNNKGVFAAIFAAIPLTGLILYFALTGQQQVRTDQQRHEVRQEIEAEKFDLEFDQMSRDINGEPMTPEEIAKRKEKIAKLKEKADQWDKRFDAEFQQMDEEMADLKKAIEEGKQ
ncbi:hypothetical protein [Hahella ganghwensis]|uniref:hypothetical protein n=1 Tax=Hahella ganghwensis TaxID=286420 RepID=UPI00036B21C1|nr:hypothetical protein [Hahella ganghwensis]